MNEQPAAPSLRAPALLLSVLMLSPGPSARGDACTDAGHPPATMEQIHWPYRPITSTHPILATYGDSLSPSNGYHNGTDPIAPGPLADVYSPLTGIVRHVQPERQRHGRNAGDPPADRGRGFVVLDNRLVGTDNHFWMVGHLRDLSDELEEGACRGEDERLGRTSNWHPIPHVHLESCQLTSCSRRGRSRANPLIFLDPPPTPGTVRIDEVQVWPDGTWPGPDGLLDEADVYSDVDISAIAHSGYGASEAVEPGIYEIALGIEGPTSCDGPGSGGDPVIPEKLLVKFGPYTELPRRGQDNSDVAYAEQVFGSSNYVVTNALDTTDPGYVSVEPGVENVAENAWATESTPDACYDVSVRAQSVAPSGPPNEATQLVPVIVNNFTPCLVSGGVTCSREGTDLTVELRFSESIRRSSLYVTYGESAPYEDHVIVSAGSTGTWSKTVFDDDTWRDTIKLATEKGTFTVKVQARDRSSHDEVDGEPGTPLTETCIARGNNGTFNVHQADDTSYTLDNEELCATCRQFGQPGEPPCDECKTGIYKSTDDCGCLFGICWGKYEWDLSVSTTGEIIGAAFDPCCDDDDCDPESTWWESTDSGEWVNPADPDDVWQWVEFDNPVYPCGPCIPTSRHYFKWSSCTNMEVAVRYAPSPGGTHMTPAYKTDAVDDAQTCDGGCMQQQ